MARILLVDDDPVILQMVNEFLRDAAHEVTTAANGMEALKLARSAPFDLVITDLVMPEKEGIETILALRKESPTTKIIAMSGSTEDYLTVARKLGASGTLAKPFSRQQLLDAVASVLSSG